MKSVAVLLLAAVLAALPSAAHAATLAVSTGGSPRVMTISINAATRVTVSRVGNDLYVAGKTGDTFNPATPSGCSSVTDAINCGSGIARVVFNGSNGNDELSVSPDITAVIETHAGNGADELNGAAGNDTLFGDGGNDVIRGGSGNDSINGGEGDDLILGELGADTVDGGNGADMMYGGGQAGDTVSYFTRTAPVAVDLGAGIGGVAGENDLVSDFTVVYGGSGNDTLIGGPAADRLDGNNGNDVLSGGDGADDLRGGNGNDLISGGAGADTLNGGADTDFLDARDGILDAAIACGSGPDRLLSDAADPATSDCEVIAPTVVGDVTVAGSAAEGSVLSVTFSGRVTGTESTRKWIWSRCGADACVPVGENATYEVTAADGGATLVATLRADNDAGFGVLASAPVGPVAVAPVAAPPPPPPPAKIVPAALSVRAVSCSGRHCKLTVRVSGDVASLKAVLTRSGKTVASVTRKAPTGQIKFNVTAKRTLRKGSYKLKVTVTGKDGRAKSTTRTVRIRR